MFSNKSTYYPKKSQKLYLTADLTGDGSGQLKQQNVFNAYVRNNKLYSEVKFDFLGNLTNVVGMCYLPNGEYLTVRTNTVHRTPRGIMPPLAITNMVFASPTFYVWKEKNTALISDNTQGTHYFDGTTLQEVTNLNFESFARYRDRLFGVNNNKLYFSLRNDVMGWKEYINLPFRAVGVAEVSDGVLILGDDIYKLQFDDDVKNSKLVLMCKNVGKVLPHTIANVNGAVYFATARGVSCFRNGKVESVDLGIDVQLDSSVIGAGCEDTYYFACPSSAESGCNDLLIAYDTVRHKVRTVFDNMDVVGINTFYKLVVVNFNRNNVLSSTRGKAVWQSALCDCNLPFVKKRLTDLYIQTCDSVEVIVTCENEKRYYNITGSARLQKIPINGLCNKFSVQLSGVLNNGISHLGIGLKVIE